MSCKPLITVVIPAFNKMNFIERAISSVLEQTFKAWEAIIVDDGSTDQTAEKALAIRDPRIRVIKQSNQGVSSARNRGVLEANTEWIAFLDADDMWMPGFLRAVARGISDFPNASVIFTNGFDQTGSHRKLSLTNLPQSPFVIDDYCRFFLSHRAGINSSRVAVRKESLQSVGGFPVGVKNWEDLDTWARLSWIGKVVCIPTPLSIRFQDVPGSASKVGRKKPTGFARIWNTYLEWKEKGLIPDHLVQSAQEYAGYFAFWYLIAIIRTGDLQSARAEYGMIKNLILDPRRRRLLDILLDLPGNSAYYVWGGLDWLRRYLKKIGLLFRF